ncbi:hypothetical protein [Apilactobacillus timberlakei]|uniref:hypothetical protein n=1 Tax=Apilactobacillus timberlakei TaxID=2008380 RepID=UPI0015E86F05|nr:hypothetical protein [Apilactobacillus timberlakei]
MDRAQKSINVAIYTLDTLDRDSDTFVKDVDPMEKTDFGECFTGVTVIHTGE